MNHTELVEAALKMVDGSETDAELEVLANEVLARVRPVFGNAIYVETTKDEDGDDEETEYDIGLNFWVDPAEPDVGLNEPSVADIEVESISYYTSGDELDPKSDEFKRVEKLIENDKEWVHEAAMEAIKESEEAAQERRGDRRYE